MMASILRDLPFRVERDEVHVGGQRVTVRPYQIIVWVSLAGWRTSVLPPQAPRFPALLDTGLNHHFSIRAEHLSAWAQLPVGGIRQVGDIRIGAQRLALHGAHLWLHANVPGHRDRFRDVPARRLLLDRGIAVYPAGSAFPPLPTLGVRALVHNRLHLVVDSERCVVQLRTPDWHTRLLRWLC